ncbi:MAG: hypothetical protein RJB26_1388 [Pseudomonadota bacterium]|jgi:ribonuclease R
MPDLRRKRKEAATAHWQQADVRQAAEAEKYANPIPSREFLLETLREAAVPLTADAIAEALTLQKEPARSALDKRLGAMVRDGQLITNRNREFLLVSRTALVVGRVMGHRDGFGFLVPDDGTPDVFLSPRQMREVMDRDRVAVRLTGIDARGRPEGSVVEVLERNTRQVAGRFAVEAGVGFITPSNRRLSHRVVVPPPGKGEAPWPKSGSLVVAELVQPPSRHADPVGRIARSIDQEHLADMAVETAIVSHQLPSEFSAAVVREARRFGKSVDLAGAGPRLDVRDLPLVTIDGEDSRDFDDAVYATPVRGGGWRLLVAIADVSHYVRPGMALDDEARERATSVYFPHRVLPMLPEQLSNQLCSLMPEVERLCLVCDMRIGLDGKVSRARFASAVMRSHARLTYTRVAGILVDRNGEAAQGLSSGVLGSLDALHQVYFALRQRREQRGALDFESAEVRVVVDAEGEVADLKAYPRNDAHRLIEECMVAANVEAARFLHKQKMPALFRVHAPPDEERIDELKRFLATRGVFLPQVPEITPAVLQETLQQVHGRPDAAMLESMVIRSLSQAVYQPENIGHFGLALAEYAHFTSPIRRYPDLLVHRAIRHVLEQGTHEDFVHSASAMVLFGQECSLRERRADEAAREVTAFLKCEYVRHRLGEEFDGIVTGVTEFGLFVQLQPIQVDGLVHISSLGQDYFTYESDRKCLTGERTRVRYTLGDRLRVRVTRVESSERKVDLELLRVEPGAFHPRRPGGGHVAGPFRGADRIPGAVRPAKGKEKGGGKSKPKSKSKFKGAGKGKPSGKPKVGAVAPVNPPRPAKTARRGKAAARRPK